MNCSVFCQILEEAREPGSPAAARRAELESHARACAGCASLLAAEDRLHASLASLRESSRVVPFGFETRVKRAVREAEAARTQAGSRQMRARWPVFVSALASAIALGAIVMITVRDTPNVRSISADGRTLQLGAADDVTPVLFSDGRLEVTSSQSIVASPPPAAAPAGMTSPPPVPAPAPPAQGAGVVLVEWEL